MDFLSSIPEAAKPMPPIGPGPDGTPPLPLINEPSAIPSRPALPVFTDEPDNDTQAGETMTDKPKDDVFESDPFFSNEPEAPQAEPEAPSDTAEPGIEPDVAPPEYDDATFDAPALETPEAEPVQPPASAEERLLDTIVGQPDTRQPDSRSPELSAELEALRTECETLKTELATAQSKARNAAATHTQTRQDLQILKTRFSTLESDLAAARADVSRATQLKTEAEARLTASEQEWAGKIDHLRHMLDEVEDMHDEQMRKRVPKLLFIATLVTGIVATAFAYFIGANQAPREQVDETPPPSPPPREAVAPPVLPPASPILATGSTPAGKQEIIPPQPVPAPVVAPAPAAQPVRPEQPRNLQQVSWPALEGARWRISETAKSRTITFQYGIFTRGVEFSTDAKQDLKTIATAIKTKGNRFRVEVVGHTDSTRASGTKSSAANNKALGLARAKAAASYLVKTCGLPAASVTASSAGQENPPYPNTTVEGQKKNRTVVLKITAFQP